MDTNVTENVEISPECHKEDCGVHKKPHIKTRTSMRERQKQNVTTQHAHGERA